MEQERIERDAGAVGLTDYSGFVVPVDFVFFQLTEIFLSSINAIHLTELLIQGQTIDGDSIALEDFGL